MPNRAVCVLPSDLMLTGDHNMDFWLHEFEQMSGRPATDIVLPAVSAQGPTFPSEWRLGEASSETKFGDWIRSVKAAGDARVWAWFNVDGSWIKNPAGYIRDQYDQCNGQACIVNPTVQEVFKSLIGEIIEHGVDGVCLDVTDAFPNSGASGLVPDAKWAISCNCFCQHCVKQLLNKRWVHPKEAFVGREGLATLVLQVREAGTAPIDIKNSWIEEKEEGIAKLLNTALARGFISEEILASEKTQEMARRLLDYAKARVAVTAEAIRELTSPCRERNIASAACICSADLDFTQLVNVPAISRTKAVDEVWLPAESTEDLGDQKGIQFLAAKSSYSANAFFDSLAAYRNSQSGGQGRATATQSREEIADRALRLIRTNNLCVSAATFSGKCFDGFAGIPVRHDTVRSLLDHYGVASGPAPHEIEKQELMLRMLSQLNR